MKIKNNRAFTLIELIVTIAVLGILVLLAAPKFSGHIKDAELTRGFADAKSIQKASEMYFMDNEDWPRLTDEPYTSEEIKAYSEHIYDTTGKEIQLNPSGNYYNIDYDKLSKYVKVPTNKENYILQNPVGKVFYMDKLTEAGKDRVDYANGSVPSEPEEPAEEYTSATFTNAEATGMTGPTQEQIASAYIGTSLEGKVVSNAGIQTWVVPKSGTYRIEAYGAQGGDSNVGSEANGNEEKYGGGSGAMMSGEFNLENGNELEILVGQKGSDAVYASGGGASGAWIDNSSSPMIIAGAGGGANSVTSAASGKNATILPNGISSKGAGGTNGAGGKSGGITGGGGGWNSNGGNGISAGGIALKAGAKGGKGYEPRYDGSFGGGGGSFGGGGGGGGYSGGGGGLYTSSTATSSGGGGGSFNAGENQVNSVGHSGHGKVVITYIGE